VASKQLLLLFVCFPLSSTEPTLNRNHVWALLGDKLVQEVFLIDLYHLFVLLTDRVKTIASITNINSLWLQFVSVFETAVASLSNKSMIGTSVSQYLQFPRSVVRWLRVSPRIRNFLEYFSSHNLHQPFLSVTEIP
jgi:hypothetical protein